VSRVNNAKNEVASVGGTSLSYDNDGNALSDGTGETFTYDAWNRLVGIGGLAGGATDTTTYMADLSVATESFSSTQSGTRANQNTTTTIHIDLYESAANQVLEQDAATYVTVGLIGGGNPQPEGYGGGKVSSSTTQGEISSSTTQYVWGLTYVNDLVERDDSGSSSDLSYGMAGSGLNERLYAVRDANHEVVALTDISGNVLERFDYSPYGTQTVLNSDFGATADAYNWDVGFQGGVQIGVAVAVMTGLIQFDNRVYDSALGRWLQPDPAGYVDGPNDLAGFLDNPKSILDPSGLDGDYRYPYLLHPALPRLDETIDNGGIRITVTPNISVDKRLDLVDGPQFVPFKGRPIEIKAFGPGLLTSCHWIQFIKRNIVTTDGPTKQQDARPGGYNSNIDPTQLQVPGDTIRRNWGTWYLDELGGYYADQDTPKGAWFIRTPSSVSYIDLPGLMDATYTDVEQEVATFDVFLVCCGVVKYGLTWSRFYDAKTNTTDYSGIGKLSPNRFAFFQNMNAWQIGTDRNGKAYSLPPVLPQ
jgi:RHS repeat-associated protein